MSAASSGSEEVCRLLISAGAVVNASDRTGATSLMLAAKFTQSEGVCRLLIAAAADVNAADMVINFYDVFLLQVFTCIRIEW